MNVINKGNDMGTKMKPLSVGVVFCLCFSVLIVYPAFGHQELIKDFQDKGPGTHVGAGDLLSLADGEVVWQGLGCLLYTSPSPRNRS